MRKIVFRGFVTALALMLLCGTALSEVHTTGNVWMRTGPGLDYDAISSFGEGKTLEYLGETEVDDRGVAWYKVSGGGKTGWVSSRYSELIGEPAASDDEADDEADDDAAVEPDVEPAVEPDETEPVSLPALNAGVLFDNDRDETGAEAEGEPETEDDAVDESEAEDEAPEDAPASPVNVPARPVELSGHYLNNLVEAANELGLISYRQVESEAPYQYYNDSVIIAGNQQVENIVVYGEGYEVYGVSVGMDIRQARACLNAAGLDYLGSTNAITYEHKAVGGSLFTDANGHDSCINVWVDENDTVTEIDWSSYTG